MIAPLYGCRELGNECELRNSCIRYAEEPSARLWAMACNEENQYLLYIKKPEKLEDKEEKE